MPSMLMRNSYRVVSQGKANKWPKVCCGSRTHPPYTLISFSSKANTNNTSTLSSHPLLHFRSTRLGLDPLILSSIHEMELLPEISNALSITQPNISITETALHRALEIFRPAGGDHYIGTMALLSEVECALAGSKQESMNYEQCLRVLLELQEVLNHHPIVRLALAKTYWLNGEFGKAKEICDILVDLESVSKYVNIAARTGQAVSRLCAVQSVDDVFSVRDPFRMTIKSLEGIPNSTTAIAAAYMNAGIAEVIWAENVQSRNSMTVPIDPAMRCWKTGLDILKNAKPISNKSTPSDTVRALLQARLNSNMAWGLLQMTHLPNHVEEASGYANKALALYDKNPAIDTHNKEGLAMALSLLATCYHKREDAVTAEGLYKSALDQPILYPWQRLERCDALRRYATLCREWEKREGEERKLLQNVDSVNASLPGLWKGKSSMHSSLWFWTPMLFEY